MPRPLRLFRYEKYRPGYDVEQMRAVLTKLKVLDEEADPATGRFPRRPVLEIGCGTGKATRAIYAVLKERCTG
jgi:SAM-dependent methyltransferase